MTTPTKRSEYDTLDGSGALSHISHYFFSGSSNTAYLQTFFMRDLMIMMTKIGTKEP